MPSVSRGWSGHGNAAISAVWIVHDGGGAAALAQSQPSLFSDGIFVFRCRETDGKTLKTLFLPMYWRRHFPEMAGQCRTAASGITLQKAWPRSSRKIARFNLAADGPDRPILSPLRGCDRSVAQSDRWANSTAYWAAVCRWCGHPARRRSRIGKSTPLLQTIAKMAQSCTSFCYVLPVREIISAQGRFRRLRSVCRQLPHGQQMCIAMLLGQTSVMRRRGVSPRVLEQHFRVRCVVVIDPMRTMYSDATAFYAPWLTVSAVRECAGWSVRAWRYTGLHRVDIDRPSSRQLLRRLAACAFWFAQRLVAAALFRGAMCIPADRLIRAIAITAWDAAKRIWACSRWRKTVWKGVCPTRLAIFLASYCDDTARLVRFGYTAVPQPPAFGRNSGIGRCCARLHAQTPSLSDWNKAVLRCCFAVLNCRGGIACFDQDVFLNAVGGVKIGEPAGGLAVILAMFFSFRNRPVWRAKTVVFGEIA